MYKYTVEQKHINGLSLVEYRPQKPDKKNVIFYLHGHRDSKEGHGTYYTSNMARLGYTVIVIDAYGHGERKTDNITFEENEKGLIDFITILKTTAKDIVSLYQTHYKNEFDTVTLVGLSMGGMIVLLSQVIAPIFNNIICLVSTPDFYNFARYYIEQNEHYKEEDLHKIEHVKLMSPSNHTDKFINTKMLFILGKHDARIKPELALDFVKKMNKEDITYQEFDCGHHLNETANQYFFNWLQNNIE